MGDFRIDIFIERLKHHAKNENLNVSGQGKKYTIKDNNSPHIIHGHINIKDNSEGMGTGPSFLEESVFLGDTKRTKNAIRGLINKSSLDIYNFVPFFKPKEALVINNILKEMVSGLDNDEKEKFFYDSLKQICKNMRSEDRLDFIREDGEKSGILFSSSNVDNPLTLIDYAYSYESGYLNFKSKIERVVIDSVFENEMAEKNLKSHEDMNNNVRGMFERNIPSHLRKYISYEGYEKLTSIENIYEMQSNKLETYKERNIQEYNNIISDLCISVDGFKDRVLSAIRGKNIKIDFDEKEKKFIPRLDFKDMKILKKNGLNNYLANELINTINSERIIDESCAFRANPNIPFTYLKNGNAGLPDSDNFFSVHPEFITKLDDKLSEIIVNLDGIKTKFSELVKFYQYNMSNGHDYYGDYDHRLKPLKRSLAEEISNFANFMNDNSENLFCGMAVSDVLSSSMCQYVNLRDLKGNLIHFNTSELSNNERNSVLNENKLSDRKKYYADLIYKIEEDDGEPNGLNLGD